MYVDKLKKELQKYLPKLERWTKEYDRFTTASYQGWKKGDATEKARTLESAKELLRQIKSMGWGVQNMSSELRRIRDVADSIVSPSGKMHKQGRHSWRHGKEWEKIYKICRFFREAVSDMEEGCEHTIKYNGQYLVTTPSAPTVEVRLIKENFNSVR
ncbi:MAG: hypothetical protein IJG38_02275 [Thermoguttaceae bacterium]|nr:hypothetical protein [Thermoguttaceae bacterium]